METALRTKPPFYSLCHLTTFVKLKIRTGTRTRVWHHSPHQELCLWGCGQFNLLVLILVTLVVTVVGA